MNLLPVLVIAAIFGAVAVLGFGGGDGIDKKQVEQEVTTLLSGIPQEGATLGSPDAPITVLMFADLECPTVKRFAELYLPSIIDKWVRNGIVKLKYRSLQTDTFNERTFFRQEIAAMAAGRQSKMWNFLLTFVHGQGQEFSNYATDSFLTDIASRVPGLKRDQWRRDREDADLTQQVILGLQFGRAKNLRYTPSFLVGLSGGNVNRRIDLSDRASIRREVTSSLRKDVRSLREEASDDIPILGVFGGKQRG